LKAFSVAIAIREVTIAIWNWSDISTIFVRILKGHPKPRDEEITSRALRDDEQPMKKAIYEAREVLKKLHEVGASDRLKDIVKKTRKKSKEL